MASRLAMLTLALALATPSSALAQDEAAPAETEAAEAEVPAPAEVEAAPEEPEAEPEPPAEVPHIAPRDYGPLGAQIRLRNDLVPIHRAFGIATWGAMLTTVVLGFLQYYNLYGFGSLEDTPCVRGTAIFGQSQCWGTPWPHLIGAATTTALYTTTFVLSLVMPDPLDEAAGARGADLRLHKDLRWVHLGGMIAQVLLGVALGTNLFGLERANDFEAMRAIATVHQIVGFGTLGVLTAAGLIMLF